MSKNAFKDKGALIYLLKFGKYGFLSDFQLYFPLNLTAWSLLQLPQIWEHMYFSLCFVSYLLWPEETGEIMLKKLKKYCFPRFEDFGWGEIDRKAPPSSSAMHLWSPKPTHDLIHICMRANLPKTASFKHFSLSWGPSKILQPLSEGRGNRLTICQIRS